MRITSLLLVTVIATPPVLPAQRLAPSGFAPVPLPTTDTRAHQTAAFGSRVSTAARSLDDESVDVPKLALAGVLGGFAGIVLGGQLGYRAFGDPFTGVFVGEGIGTAMGVHLANERRGPALAEIALSVGLGVLGGAAANRGNNGAFLLAVPLVQIASAISMEQRAEDED